MRAPVKAMAVWVTIIRGVFPYSQVSSNSALLHKHDPAVKRREVRARVPAILIVEDSRDDAELLHQQLAAAGLCNPCHTVSCGAAALAYVEGQGQYADREKYPFPSVVLLDLKMPEMDGFEVLERLRRLPEVTGILVVAVSALDDLESIRRAYQLGANSFVAKPCRKADVLRLIYGFPGYWTRTPNDASPRLETRT
jgi:CheY-like chemotaxis protein